MVCAALTWMLIGYALFVVIFVMLLPEIDCVYNCFNASAFIFFAFLAVVAHLKAMVTDPVSQDYAHRQGRRAAKPPGASTQILRSAKTQSDKSLW